VSAAPALMKVGESATVSEKSSFNWTGVTAALTRVLPPVPWLIEEMELGPGRPCGLWGLGGGGKTWDAIELSVSVATGTDAFGKFKVRQGTVSYLSHELGLRPITDRHRRIANGRKLQLEDFGDRLRIAALPKIYLNSKDAEQHYLDAFDGVDFVVLDSLRRALPGADENASEISNYLDILNRVSDKTGATFLVLHHFGKGGVEDARLSGRGSSAIMDGSGCIWTLEGKDAAPRKMTQIRAHDDGDGGRKPFYIAMDRVVVPEPAFPANGPPARLVYREEAEMSQVLATAAVKNKTAKLDQTEALIVQTVRDNPGIAKARLETIVTQSRLATQKGFRGLVTELIEREQIRVVEGPKNAHGLVLVSSSTSTLTN
jgi:hypothetical protein